MYTLIIVDDEYLVREGLKETVDWGSLGIEVVGTADNGQVGLALAREKKPDLIIADVRMPVMDGLDMAKALFDEKADLAVIMYSGYKDFEYARRAMDSGVYGFLLKPIEEGELVERVGEVLQKLKDKRESDRMLGQFKHNMPLIRRRQFERLLQNASDREAASEQLRLLGVSLPTSGTLLYCRTDNNIYIKTFIEHCEKLFSRAECESESFDGYAVIVTPLSEKDMLNRLDGFLDRLLTVTDARFSVAVCEYDGNISEAFRKAQSLCGNTLFSAVNAIATESGVAYKKLVRDALKIIERDYDKKISVRSVADALYTSESSLMHEFKKQVGKTFNECLTDFRMLKAQELLTIGDMRVGEIAYAVGYSDVRYFGQVFRDYMGCTPSEYISQKRK